MKMPLPKQVRLEGSSICQLRCPLCVTTLGLVHNGAPGKGNLKPDDFETFLRKNSYITRVELSNWGEVVLNPHFIDLLKIARECQVQILINNGLNLNTASEEVLEALVKYRVRSVTVSLDGATQATYEKYRVGGNIDTVLAHVDKINAFKRQHRSPVPILIWQFIPFGHNEHEIPLARQMAQERQMVFYMKKNYVPDYAPTNEHLVVSGVDIPVSEIHTLGEKQRIGIDCAHIWSHPQINWDGRILGCCTNTWGEFGGNAFTDDPEDWFNSEGIQRARQMLTGKADPIAGNPCTDCPTYHQMVRTQEFLTPDDFYEDSFIKVASS